MKEYRTSNYEISTVLDKQYRSDVANDSTLHLRVHYLTFPDVASRLPSTGLSRWLQLFGGVIVPDLGLGIETVKILQCKNKPKNP